jgi:two-component system C4-dicarboxylate transport sensor histidine kinase DctB
MPEDRPSDEWIEAANCLSTVAHQLSSAVHEANNLLQVIAGSAEMIQVNDQLPERVLARAATIFEHAHRVSTLLGGVRELSKFAPRDEADTADLGSVVNSALDLRRHALTRAQIDVSFDPGPLPATVRASWRTAMQIVLNLLLNAERALNGRSEAAIVIRAERAGDTVVLSLADNGPGLPLEIAPFRVQPSADGPPLLGLGLRVASWLAAQEGGCLDVESRPDGTTAVLTLASA